MDDLHGSGKTILCTQTVGKEVCPLKNRENDQKNAQKEPNEQKEQKTDRK